MAYCGNSLDSSYRPLNFWPLALAYTGRWMMRCSRAEKYAPSFSGANTTAVANTHEGHKTGFGGRAAVRTCVWPFRSVWADIANAFSRFFSVHPNLSTTGRLDNSRRVSQSRFIFPTSPSEVRNTILNIKNTSRGLDNISSFHIKEILDYIVDALVFKTGVFPKELTSKIVPVFKKGNRSNYRSISILPFFRKVLEKLIEKRLCSYLQKFNLLSPRQFGFRPGYSNNLALIALKDMIKSKIDEGKFVGCAFIDFTKAFDTIYWPQYAFPEINILWDYWTSITLTSQLLDREQTVCISGVLSHTAVHNIGVPQGSILGPILFLLYINDLPNCLSSINNCLLYADDTTVFASDANLDTLTSLLKNDEKNKLCIYPQKTHYMVFSSPNRVRRTISPIYVNTHAIYPSQHCSF